MKPQFYETAARIDQVLENATPSVLQMESTLKLLDEPGLSAYFCSRVENPCWFHVLKKHGFFGATNNPSPKEVEKDSFSIPHWPALDYLEKLSTRSAKDPGLAKELMEIVRDVTRSSKTSSADNYRTWWVFAKMMSNFPTDAIELEDIQLIDHWLAARFETPLLGHELGESLLPRFLESRNTTDWDKATVLVTIVTRFRRDIEPTDDEFEEPEPYSRTTSHWLGDLLRKNAKQLGEKCGKIVAPVLLDLLDQLLNPSEDTDFSYIWYQAIEDEQRNVGRHSAKNILTTALRDVVAGYSSAHPAEAEETIKNLLKARFSVPKRIALHVIDKNFNVYQGIFWDLLSSELFDINLEHELKQLLKKHFRAFSEEHQRLVVSLVESLTRNWREDADKELLDAQLRARWLQSIEGQGSEKADHLYKECIIKSKTESAQQAPNAGVGFGQVPIKALISLESLLQMDVPELIEFGNDFKGTGYLGEPTEDGLADLLSNAVQDKPEKYEDSLGAFLGSKRIYQVALLRGFEQRWRQNKAISWEKILDFASSILDEDVKSTVEDATSKSSMEALASTIGGLIESGVKSDDRALDEAHFQKAENLITRILEILPISRPTVAPAPESRSPMATALEVQNTDPWEGDALTHAMNTARGRCLEALIAYSLRQARILDSRKQDRNPFWERIRPVFDHQLVACKDGNFEFSAFCGSYLPNFYYLSKAWVESNISSIFPQSHNLNWRCAIDGYSYVTTVYRPIYDLLKRNGDLEAALKSDFGNAHVLPKLVQNITIAYTAGWESLSDPDGLFTRVVKAWRKEHISEIISFLWMYREQDVEGSVRQRILEFWRFCFQKLNAQSDEEQRDILSHLNLLAVFLREISGEQKEWLLQCSPFAGVRYHAPFLIEYLDKLADGNPDAVGEVYLKLLSGTLPTHDPQHIRSIVEKLFKAGKKEAANEICEVYARSGFPEMLRSLYERYN